MEAEDWKVPASDYDENILSVYDNDQDGKIGSIIKRLGGEKRPQSILVVEPENSCHCSPITSGAFRHVTIQKR